MDPDRVRAYLQVACAGLGFDIGEVWWTVGPEPRQHDGNSGIQYGRPPPPKQSSESFRFVQLYTSKSYADRRSMLVNPPEDDRSYVLSNGSDLEKHVLSPLLVDAIAKTSQVVWANTKKQEGLLGRSDIKLQTAVGLPVVVDSSGNMCVVVMFSPNNVQSSDDALEYLQSINFSASSSKIPSLMPAFDPEAGLLAALSQTSQFPNAAIPLLSSHFADGITTRFVPLGGQGNMRMIEQDPAQQEVKHERDVKTAPKDSFGIPMLPIFAEMQGVGSMNAASAITGSDAFDEASYGIWSTVMDADLPDCLDAIDNVASDPEPIPNEQMQLASVDEPPPAIDPDRVFFSQEKKDRLEEFISAFLTMSIFDFADVWMPASESSTHLLQALSISSLKAHQLSSAYEAASASTSIRFWSGCVGRAFSSGNPVWSNNFSSFTDEGRAEILKKMKIQTVFAVPIFAGKSTVPEFVLGFYSLVRAESVPFVLRFVQQAVRLLWDGLDQADPHESVGEHMWRQIAPADLGEMAADDEMQRHFLTKKRPRSASIADLEPTREFAPSPTGCDDSSTGGDSQVPYSQSIYVGKEARPMSPGSRCSSIESMSTTQHSQTSSATMISNNWSVHDGATSYPAHKRLALASKSYPNFQTQESFVAAPISSPEHSSSMPDLQNANAVSAPAQSSASVFSLPASILPVSNNVTGFAPPPAPRPLFMPSLVGIPFPPAPTGHSLFTSDQQRPQQQESQQQQYHHHHHHHHHQQQQSQQQSQQQYQQQYQQQQSQQQQYQQQPQPQQQQQYQQQPQQQSTNVVDVEQTPMQQPPVVFVPMQSLTNQALSPLPSTCQPAPTPAQASVPAPTPTNQFNQSAPPNFQTSYSPAQSQGAQQFQTAPVQNTGASQNQPSSPAPTLFQCSHQVPGPVQSQPNNQTIYNGYGVPSTSMAAAAPSQPRVNYAQAQAPTPTSASFLAAVPTNEISASGITLQQSPVCQPILSTSGPAPPQLTNINLQHGSTPLKPCRIQGCSDPALPRRPHCSRHSGNRLCEHEGCKKCAQGSTRFCIAHGGGRRCTYPGCDKGARDKFFCAAHGGGKRCRFEGCAKSAVGGSHLCTAHGGGKRCSVDGCDKSAQSSTKFCVKHGGGKQCLFPECAKVARGRTLYCASHGGGVRCALDGCNRLAIGKAQLCRTHGGGSRSKSR